MLTERGRTALEGISETDSITFDSHKGFWMPWGCGSLLVRDPKTLHNAFFAEVRTSKDVVMHVIELIRNACDQFRIEKFTSGLSLDEK